jgi:hypothetical protein
MMFPLDGGQMNADGGDVAPTNWYAATAYLSEAAPVLILPKAFQQVQDRLKWQRAKTVELHENFDQPIPALNYEQEMKWETTADGEPATGVTGDTLPRLAAWLTRPKWKMALVKVTTKLATPNSRTVRRITELNLTPWTTAPKHPSLRKPLADATEPLTSIQQIHDLTRKDPGITHWVMIGSNPVHYKTVKSWQNDDPDYEMRCQNMRAVVRQQEFFQSAPFYAELKNYLRRSGSNTVQHLRFHTGTYQGWQSVLANGQTEKFQITQAMGSDEQTDAGWGSSTLPTSEWDHHAIRVTSFGRVNIINSSLTCPIRLQQVLSTEKRLKQDEIETTEKMLGAPDIRRLGPDWNPLTACNNPRPLKRRRTQANVYAALENAPGLDNATTEGVRFLVPERIEGWNDRPNCDEEKEENLILLQFEIWKRVAQNLNRSLGSPLNHQYFDVVTGCFEKIQEEGRTNMLRRARLRRHAAKRLVWMPREGGSAENETAPRKRENPSRYQLDVMF